MIGIKVVHKCPHTDAATGVMHMNHKVLGILAGAVWDKNEWMAFLIGVRSPDGLSVMVTDLRIPLQRRGHGMCETVNEEPLAPDVVGVVHSHHTMGAFFSQTDDTKLNPRFPTSIVVSQPKHNSKAEHELLGFCYKAEGRVPLPCGTPGIIEFTVQPAPFVKDWPVMEIAKFGEPKGGSLTFCPHTTSARNELMQTTTAKCGLVGHHVIENYFGRDSASFIAAVEKQTEAIVNEYPGYQYVDKRHGQGKGKQHAFQDGPWNEDQWLRGWSEYPYGAYGGD